LLDAGFVDTFRQIHPDLTDAYSWWSYRMRAREKNVGWRIDYFVVSERLTPKIENANIRADIYGSDHCPVELDLAL
ncbi:MAG: exodeoxyribonuclease III, partial [Muribaculaceae bacterium]|nr:exodeoxyribonuclease III [Muribaculaceae bacterium]